MIGQQAEAENIQDCKLVSKNTLFQMILTTRQQEF
jgi:hypothetical protein